LQDILAIGTVAITAVTTLVFARRMTKPLGRSAALVIGAIVGGGYITGIALLYRLNEGYVPTELDRAFYPGLAAMLVGAILLVRSLQLSDNSPALDFQGIDWFGIQQRRWRGTITKQTRQRLKRLDADPRRRKYAALIRKGEYWSDDAIAYDLDPNHLASCEHLQPYERAMRRAGIPLNLGHAQYLSANCCVDIEALDRQLPRPPEVHFLEIPGDRYGDALNAVLRCTAHQNSIYVVHTTEARPDTPWFPPGA